MPRLPKTALCVAAVLLAPASTSSPAAESLTKKQAVTEARKALKESYGFVWTRGRAARDLFEGGSDGV
jgi:hypothetical protein